MSCFVTFREDLEVMLSSARNHQKLYDFTHMMSQIPHIPTLGLPGPGWKTLGDFKVVPEDDSMD